MTKVSSHTPETSLQRAQDTAKLTQPTNDALRSSRAAETAFDATFGATPALARSEDDGAKSATQSSVEEQLKLFSALTPLIGARPSGAAAEPFELSTEAVLPPPVAFEELSAAFQKAGDRKLAPALARLNDTIAARDLGALQARLTQHAVGQKIKISPQVMAQIKAQVVAPMIKGLGRSQSADSAVTASGVAQPSSTTAPATKSNVVQPNYGLVANTIASQIAAKGQAGGGMDIDQLVETVIMECGQDSELDLRQIASEMQVHIDKSAALRKLQEQQNSDSAQVKSKVDLEYQSLVQEGAIDPKNCTQEQYESWRPVAVTDPVIDDATSPPSIQYTPPSLAQPDPVNASDLPGAWAPAPPTPSPAQQFGLPQSVYAALNALHSDLQIGGLKMDTQDWLAAPPPNGVGLAMPVATSAEGQANLALALAFAQKQAGVPVTPAAPAPSSQASESGGGQTAQKSLLLNVSSSGDLAAKLIGQSATPANNSGSLQADAQAVIAALNGAQPNVAAKQVPLSQQIGVPDNVLAGLRQSLQLAPPPCGGSFNNWLTDAASGLGLTVPVNNAGDAQANLTAISAFAGTSQSIIGGSPATTSGGNSKLKKELVDEVPRFMESLDSNASTKPAGPPKPKTGVTGAFKGEILTSFKNVDPLEIAETSGATTPATADHEQTDSAAVAQAKQALSAEAGGAQVNLPPATSLGAQFVDANGNQVTTHASDLTLWSGKTADLLQDQSDITQQMQLKIQMAQQAYSQCMQMVSNILKSSSDTKDGIIKNLTT